MAQKRSVIGILAHVDAGKTTLAEAMLYTSGAIRTLGRVDHGDAFLDNFSLERERGITIFSKQAPLTLPTLQATLLDTPGHVDFSAEMERALDVLDCAVLVISAPAGVQSHTRTLWKLLRHRNIPTLLFLNKTDLPCPDRAGLLDLLRRELGDGFFDFERPDGEHLALC
ncbi:MAG: GTP-binding protein, partial [Oscillospiraceae bacterium]